MLLFFGSGGFDPERHCVPWMDIFLPDYLRVPFFFAMEIGNRSPTPHFPDRYLLERLPLEELV